MGFEFLRSNPIISPNIPSVGSKPRKSLPWGMSEITSETGVSEAGNGDSDLDRRQGRKVSRATFLDQGLEDDSMVNGSDGMLEDDGDVFWMPYAITMGMFCLPLRGRTYVVTVSRHPIYDVMQDYLRLSVSPAILTPSDSISGRDTRRMRSTI